MNFDHFLALLREERIDPVIVCHLPVELTRKIGAKVTRVMLSAETMEKQRRKHAHLREDHYKALPVTVRCGEYRQDTPKSAVVLFVDAKLTGKAFRAYVRATENGKQIYVASFTVMGDRQYRAELRRPYPVIRPHLVMW